MTKCLKQYPTTPITNLKVGDVLHLLVGYQVCAEFLVIGYSADDPIEVASVWDVMELTSQHQFSGAVQHLVAVPEVMKNFHRASTEEDDS